MDYIDEGWKCFSEEVIKKDWPEPAILMAEVAFFSGAIWLLSVVDDNNLAIVGLTRDKLEIVKAIRAELKAHPEKMQAKNKELEAMLEAALVDKKNGDGNGHLSDA
jgi:hypothetical protein